MYSSGNKQVVNSKLRKSKLKNVCMYQEIYIAPLDQTAS